MEQFRTSEFKYWIEGGEHAIFTYRGNDERKKDTLLRFSKKRMCDGRRENREEFSEIIQRELSPFVETSEIINISTEEFDVLRLEALNSGRIPTSRIQDWESMIGGDGQGQVSAQLLRDNRCYWPDTGSVKHRDVLSLEIKPKAGYLATSPLVKPSRRVKYKTSRYQLFQRVYASGQLRKPWMNGCDFSMSNYDPIELFTSNTERALAALWVNPQNNLCLWRKEEVLLNRNTPYMCTGDVHSYSKEEIISKVSKILDDTCVLQKILKLQQLDCIDADGAICLYNRLVEVLNGDKERAELLVDEFMPRQGSSSIGDSPIEAPTRHSNLIKYLSLVSKCKALIQSNADEKVLNDLHERALGLVEVLSVSELVFLLQNFLLSLVACDLSIFVTFDLRGMTDSRTRDKEPDESQYLVRIVDVDPKPCKKLRNRSCKEAHLDNITWIDT